MLLGASMGAILARRAAAKARPGAVVSVSSSAPKRIAGRGKPSQEVPGTIPTSSGPLEDTCAAMRYSDEATIQKAWRLWRDDQAR